jgi:hypothetical protein
MLRLRYNKEATARGFFQIRTGVGIMNNCDAASRLEAMLGQKLAANLLH